MEVKIMSEKTANEFLEDIQQMKVDEKWKLLEMLYDTYFSKDHIVVEEKDEE